MGDKLQKHAECSSHLEADARWSAANQSTVSGSVLNQLDVQHKQSVVRTREAVATLVRSALFCARQSIALRGHREGKHNAGDDDCMNRGNFVELCKFVELANPKIAERSNATLPGNATYTSKQSQDEFLQAAATVIQKEIVEEIADAGMYAVIVDEARDNSCTEQMSVCVRYVQKSKCRIVESFLGFIPLNMLTAEYFSSTIITFLTDVGLDVTKCIAQSYDGASVMAGVKNGVQKLIRDASKNTCPYIHCHAHRLNLVLADVAKRVDVVADTVGLMEAIYAFQSSSTIRHRVFLNSQKNEARILSIPQQSDTRWVCKYAGVQYFCTRFGCTVQALTDISQSQNRKEAAEAQGLAQQLQSFEVLFILNVLHDLLAITQSLSLQLQSTTLDYGRCRRLIEGCLKTVKQKRDDQHFDRLWKETCDKASENGIEVPSDKQGTHERASRPPTLLQAYVTETTTGSR